MKKIILLFLILNTMVIYSMDLEKFNFKEITTFEEGKGDNQFSFIQAQGYSGPHGFCDFEYSSNGALYALDSNDGRVNVVEIKDDYSLVVQYSDNLRVSNIALYDDYIVLYTTSRNSDCVILKINSESTLTKIFDKDDENVIYDDDIYGNFFYIFDNLLILENSKKILTYISIEFFEDTLLKPILRNEKETKLLVQERYSDNKELYFNKNGILFSNNTLIKSSFSVFLDVFTTTSNSSSYKDNKPLLDKFNGAAFIGKYNKFYLWQQRSKILIFNEDGSFYRYISSKNVKSGNWTGYTIDNSGNIIVAKYDMERALYVLYQLEFPW